jgi:hypothetical protein
VPTVLEASEVLRVAEGMLYPDHRELQGCSGGPNDGAARMSKAQVEDTGRKCAMASIGWREPVGARDRAITGKYCPRSHRGLFIFGV